MNENECRCQAGGESQRKGKEWANLSQRRGLARFGLAWALITLPFLFVLRINKLRTPSYSSAARRLAHYVSHVKWLPLPPPKLKNKTRIKHSIHLQLPPRSSTSVMTSTPDRVVMCLDLLGSNVG